MVSESSLPQSAIAVPASEQEGGLQLGRFVGAIKRRMLIVLGVTTLTASAAVLKAITDTPVYNAGFELLTPPTTLETQIISTINDEALSNQSELFDVAVDETKLKILKSPRLIDPILVEIQQRYPNTTYNQVTSNLSIKPDQTGNTLHVNYTNTDPEKVAYALEIIVEAYLSYSLEDRQNAIFRGIDFVDEQLPVARQRVEELERELEGLRQSANLIDPLVQGEQLSEQAARFNAEQLDLQVQIQEAQDIYNNLQADLNNSEEFAATSVLLESDRYQALLDQILAVDSELADQLTLYLEDSPEIDVIEERRQNLQPLLQREGIRVQRQLANYIQELQDRNRALSETIGSLNNQIKNLSTTAREYGSIQRELDIASTNLNQFLTKREALRIDAAQRQTPWEILTPPSAPKASVASAKRNLVLGVVLGVLLGSGTAIIIDRFAGKIYTIEELKEAVGPGIPLLAVIPYEKLLEGEHSLASSLSQLSQLGFNTRFFSSNGEGNNGQKSVSTPFLEAFRILSTNVQLSSPDNPITSFAVSSAIPNMGKSTITFHLAHAMATTGRRVLMIDADLRRPTLHKLCNVSNEVGVSNYISSDIEIKEAISDVPIDPNLFLMSSGPMPPDPIKILTAQRMKNLLAFAQDNFDVVIFDTPPILGFADALVLAAYTQGVLLTATLGEIKFAQMQMALDELNVAKVFPLGLVANGSKQESQTRYSYYQYYREDRIDTTSPNSKYHLDGSQKPKKEVSGSKNPLSSLGKSFKNRR
ncbi:polysaccharide biosynthesis tyrosine autokinase [Oscillatoria sp. CS-180]|uniref:GumC family protein n=1 Tax=Oscillatoria sp. CS-180 TaxID=3021720 RepID=UPI002330F7BA|nr:polysaccharide biosynthesis tyrosine autokinase [Oscillatoria sp. CS-180]MDB9527496.1 polysaccharide biosynthesis tyrosine autokinase [Oscillatoria sp. CS-180]